MFGKILIANRGEIACRVIRTARRLGIATVAVYSDADRDARHVAEADQAIAIGPAPARQSYLSIPALIAAAKASGAEAIHPGYGFLSENADFAKACGEAGIVFIGPKPAAIRAMGSKAAAKALMAAAGVPLVPGYHGADQSEARLAAAAAEIGYPVLIKASAGGGGKGMRIVAGGEDFAAALAGAKREAAAAFGDDHVLIEKYLDRPRHIEIQIFADQFGDCVHLFERDCSIQRRHQKIIEEAPAPGLDPATRAAMGDAAIRCARAVGYVGAGTVEFISAGGEFHFMEMNTRLQVEHPVTEMITGLDLVEWQLRVAAGERLPRAQDQLDIDGHAIEARIYAEDPARNFLPASGTIRYLAEPAPSAHVRIDSGVRAGDRIGVHYDPMLAKLIVWDRDRGAALVRLRSALADFALIGVRNNLALLRAIAEHPDFAAAAPDTGFIPRHPELLAPPAVAPAREALAAAALHVLARRGAALAAQTRASPDPASPWAARDGWRVRDQAAEDVHLRGEDGDHRITALWRGEGAYRLTLPDETTMETRGAWDGERLRLTLDDRQESLRVIEAEAALVVLAESGEYRLHAIAPDAAAADESAGDGRVVAPIPGYVRGVLVAAEERVARGQALVVMEAMKMEITLTAPFAGSVGSVAATVGAMAEEGQALVVITPEG